MSTPQEDSQQGVEDELNAPLDAIAHIGIDKPHELLDEALKILLPDEIRKEIRDKIISEMPGHLLIFQKNLAIERKEAGSDKIAVRRAFQLTYGKFMLEADNDLKKPGSLFMETLERVTKFPIDKKLGLEGRVELEAAAARLNMAGSYKMADKYVIDKRKANGTKKDDAEAKRSELSKEKMALDKGTKATGEADITTLFEAKLDELEERQDLKIKAEDRLAFLEEEQEGLEEDLNAYKLEARVLKQRLVDLRDEMLVLMDLDNERQSIEGLIAKFDKLGLEKDFDYKAFKEFLDRDVKALLKRLAKRKLKKIDAKA